MRRSPEWENVHNVHTFTTQVTSLSDITWGGLLVRAMLVMFALLLMLGGAVVLALSWAEERMR